MPNIVFIKKANRKLWVCIEFIDLNKVYQKNSFPLPKINKLTNITSGLPHDTKCLAS